MTAADYASMYHVLSYAMPGAVLFTALILGWVLGGTNQRR